jgi:SOS response regulatory protein OraA/RecX
MDGDRAEAGGRRARTSDRTERRAERAAVQDVAEVIDAAARLIEARPRSVDEVRRRLGRLGYNPAVVAVAVDRLVELRYLDDDAFARAWVESRDRARPRGEHALRRELALKGVDRLLVEAVLEARRDLGSAAVTGDGVEERLDPDDVAAERLLRRKLAAIMREPDVRRRRERAYATLARSGFAPDICAAVSRRLLSAAAGAGELEVDAGDA